MKPNKSPENAEVTPSKKKLKQARLPFKLISETSPTPVSPQTRKRKLSAADAETVSKIGKLSKENDLTEHTVVVSDDETDTDKLLEQQKPLNPFVKLVDTAWKKKLQKSKKKKNGKKSKSLSNDSTETENNVSTGVDSINEVESMDVDLPPEADGDKSSNNDVQVVESDKEKVSKSKKATPKRKSARKTRASPRQKPSVESPVSKSSDIVVVEDSNSGDNFEHKNNDVPSAVDAEESKSEETLKKPTESENVTQNMADKAVITNGISSTEDEQNNSSSNEEESTAESKQCDEKSSKDEETIEETQTEEEKVPEIITPKRSSRNKVKVDEKEKILNKSSSKLDESVCSTPSTPKHNRSLSVTTSLDESLNESTAANLTPKQLQKKLEAAKKREERDKEKLEREKKKQQEKEEKAKQRQEKEEQRKKEKEEKEEAKRKEKEEKEEQRRKEKEEKDKQKELEKKLREEKEEQKKKEKEEKEEQRRKEKEAKEEERRKKQEALELEKQEQELKKKKAAEAFVNFFVPKQKSEKDQAASEPISKSSVLSSFAIKSDMRLAPTVRVNLEDEKKVMLENLMAKQNANKSGLYLNSLREGLAKPLSGGKTWPLSDKDEDDDIMIVEDELPPMDGAGEIVANEAAVREKLRPKLLSFHQNRRPPYWGTWRKKSANVTPRRPFGQDTKHLDYEVDSDEEWEEEPEGESVDGSAAGSDVEEDGDEYEVDNELFVPHGYLSDEEATMDDDDVLSLSPETQKARLKHLEDEFESEMKKPTEKLKPRLYGILWETKDGGKPDNCVDALWNYFAKFSMIMIDPTPLLQPSNEPEEAEKKKVKKKKVITDGEKQSPKSDKKKKTKAENKESKPKVEQKKNTPEVKKNQPGINSFLTKLKST